MKEVINAVLNSPYCLCLKDNSCLSTFDRLSYDHWSSVIRFVYLKFSTNIIPYGIYDRKRSNPKDVIVIRSKDKG